MDQAVKFKQSDFAKKLKRKYGSDIFVKWGKMKPLLPRLIVKTVPLKQEKQRLLNNIFEGR